MLLSNYHSFLMIQFFTHVKRCPDNGTFRQLLKRNWRYLEVYLVMLDPLWGGVKEVLQGGFAYRKSLDFVLIN